MIPRLDQLLLSHLVNGLTGNFINKQIYGINQKILDGINSASELLGQISYNKGKILFNTPKDIDNLALNKHVGRLIEDKIGEIGVDKDGDAVIQSKKSAKDELSKQEWVNSRLSDDLENEHHSLKTCRNDLADPRLGGNGRPREIPEIDNMIDIANQKCYPGSGTSLTDIKGLTTVTLANATIGTGNLGFIDFDGSGDSANLAAGINMGSTFSWSCFIRMGSISNGGYGYFNQMNDGSSGDYGFAMSEGGTAGGALTAGQIYWFGSNTGGNAIRLSDHALQAGVWTHVCCTIDNGASSGTIKTYINGVLDRTVTSQQAHTYLQKLGWNNGSHY